MPGSNERDDSFGYSLAVGDFDADGYADLVVGSPIEAVGSLSQAGRAVVLRGGPRGLTSSGALSLRQGLGGIPSQPAVGERFGGDLAVGDVNGDGHDDLAISVYQEADTPVPTGEENSFDQRGSAVHLLLGSPSGLTATGNQFILSAELFTYHAWRFGLAFGDFNGDGRADLVQTSADGALGVLHGHSDGLHVAPLPPGPQPGQDGTWPVCCGEEELTLAASAGDITGDGYPDVVVDSGYKAVKVILGSSAGLVPYVTSWSVPAAEYTDLAILPFSGGSHAWLAATHFPKESYNPGSVSVLRGTAAGTPGPVTVWSQDSPGIKNRAERGDGFGAVIGG